MSTLLLSFAAGHRKWFWSRLNLGCDSDLSADFLNLILAALVIFLLKLFLQSASKSSFFGLGAEIHPVLKLQFLMPLRVVLLCFAILSIAL